MKIARQSLLIFLMSVISTILMCSVSFASTSATARQFPGRVAVVDVQSILEHSTAVGEIRKFIDAISTKLQHEIANKESELKKIETGLIKKRSTMSEEAFESHVTEFNKKVSAAQKFVQEKKARLEQAHAAAIRKVHDATVAIIANLAERDHFDIALPSSQLLFVKPNLDITQEVLTLLNNKLKTVKVDY
jgi:Skp family chaperone for outer membrane proteins